MIFPLSYLHHTLHRDLQYYDHYLDCVFFKACLMTVYFDIILFFCFLVVSMSSVHGFCVFFFLYVFILYILLFDFVYVCMYVLPVYF